jgi:hypothetical protein
MMTPRASLSPVSDASPSSPSSPTMIFPRASRWKWGNGKDQDQQPHEKAQPVHIPTHHQRHVIRRGHSSNPKWEAVHEGVNSVLGSIDPAVFHVKKLAELGKQRFEAAHNKMHSTHHTDHHHHNGHHGGQHHGHHGGQHHGGQHHGGHHGHHGHHSHLDQHGTKLKRRGPSSHGRGTPNSTRSKQSRKSSKMRSSNKEFASRQSLMIDDTSPSKIEDTYLEADEFDEGSNTRRTEEVLSETPDRMTPDLGVEYQHQMDKFGLLLPTQQLYEGQLALSEYFRKYRKTKLDKPLAKQVGPATPRDDYLTACAEQNAPPEPLGIVRRRANFAHRPKAVDLSFFGVGKKVSRLAGPLGQLNFVDSLCLRGNRLSDVGTVEIVSNLGQWVCHLDLANNNIGVKGAAALGTALGLKECTIQTLCLERNNLKDEGTVFIARALLHNCSLQRLSLRGNNVGSKGCRAIALGLCPALNMYKEVGTADEKARKSNDSLEELDLSWNRITEEGAVLLCCALMSSAHWQANGSNEDGEEEHEWENFSQPVSVVQPCQIQDLDLSWNSLGHSRSAVIMLARMLRHNTSLLRLDVGYNWFDPDYPGNIGVVEKPRESLNMLMDGLANNRTLLDFFIEGTSAVIDPLGFLSLREQKLEDVVADSRAQRVAHIVPPSSSNNDWIDMNVTLDRRDRRWLQSDNPGWIAGGWSEVTIEWSPGSSMISSRFDEIEIDMRLSLDNFSPTRMTKSKAGEDVGIDGGGWIYTATRVIPPGDLLYFFTVAGELKEEEDESESDSNSNSDEEQDNEVKKVKIKIKENTKTKTTGKTTGKRIHAFISKDQPLVTQDMSFEPPITLPMNQSNYVYVEDRVGPLLLVKVQPRKPLDEPITGEIQMTSWRLSRSVYAPRERTSDSRAFLDNIAVFGRACSADLSHCRLDRLLGTRELKALEDALLPRYGFLIKYIRVQMCRSGSPHLFCLNDLEEWANDCDGLLDHTFTFEKVLNICRYVKDTSVSAAEDDDMMTRAEFLEVLVRVALSKHAPQYEKEGGKQGYTGDWHVPGDAFDTLCDLHLELRIGELKIQDPHLFRIRELYKPGVDSAFRRRLDILKLCFASWARNLHSALTFEEYYDNLVYPLMLSGKLNLSEENVRAAFGMAKMTTVDEKMIMLADGHSHFSLQFTDFLECIARLAKDHHLVCKSAEIKAKREEMRNKEGTSSPLYRMMMFGDGEEENSNSDDDSEDSLMTSMSPLDEVVAEFIDEMIRPLIDVKSTLRRTSVQVRMAHLDKSHKNSGSLSKSSARGERRRRASLDLVTQFGTKSGRILRCTGIQLIDSTSGDKLLLQEGTAQWSLRVSVWAKRKIETGDFYDTKKVRNAAFETDFENLLSKERFTNMINLYDDEGGKDEINEVREALYSCYNILLDAFEFYSFMGKGYRHSHVIDINAFNVFVEDCDLADNKTCNPTDIQNIFEFENAEENTEDAVDKNSMNDDSALMRFEFLGCIVRLAVVKYIKSNVVDDVSEAVQLICKNNIQKHLGPEAICDSNDFRKHRMYNPHTDRVFQENLKKLLFIFNMFGSTTKSGQIRMSLSQWGIFVEKAALLGDDFEEREAKLAFAWCQMAIVNELDTEQRHLKFEDFLEAIARVCDLKALPTTDELRASGTKNTAHFFHVLEENGMLPDFFEKHPTEWNEVKTRQISELLPKLLEIIYYGLEKSGIEIIEELYTRVL